MSKIIRTTVDHQGNVYTDYEGFAGNDCLSEEQRLRGELAELGIELQVTSEKSKPPEGGASTVARTRPRLSS